MPKKYTIRSGDCLSAIGERHKVPWKKIWEDPANEALRRKRGDPNVVYEGDVVTIPDPESRKEPAPTDQRHKFKRRFAANWIRVVLRDIKHQPMAGVVYHFEVDGEPEPEAKTGNDGIAEVKVQSADCDVVLHLPWGPMPVDQGHLDPANQVKGLQQRLRNLGIDPGGLDGRMGPKTAAAIRAFQGAEGLPATGEPDADTIKRLRELHEGITLDGELNRLRQDPGNDPEPMPDNEIEAQAVAEDDDHHVGSGDDDQEDRQTQRHAEGDGEERE